MYICIYIHMCIYMYIYKHTYIYIYIETSRASVAQLVRARDCQSLGRRFDSG